ncbi:MAG: hypothetical protein JO165_07310, partial [Candidatus Eremiobacteraeota bacterium]|nr:hypothetical protein [Candidatus Eremiobacteraeota bacterium]
MIASALMFASFSALPARATTAHLERVFIIMMENQGFDEVIGHQDATGRPDTPNITNLASRYGLATYAFGVTHPSLPNYLSLIGGYSNNISDDNPSCFALPNPGTACHSLPYKNLVDEFAAAHISWMAFEQSMPSPGYLGARFPANGPVLYAQKHNPFVYYQDIATNPSRLSRIVPLDNSATQLRTALANASTAPRFVLIVPDQCHDMHGTSTCSDADGLLRTGDGYVETLVNVIRNSPSFTASSAIVIT